MAMTMTKDPYKASFIHDSSNVRTMNRLEDAEAIEYNDDYSEATVTSPDGSVRKVQFGAWTYIYGPYAGKTVVKWPPESPLKIIWENGEIPKKNGGYVIQYSINKVKPKSFSKNTVVQTKSHNQSGQEKTYVKSYKHKPKLKGD